MSKRKSSLSDQEEVEKEILLLMEELDQETYNDNDSDCEVDENEGKFLNDVRKDENSEKKDSQENYDFQSKNYVKPEWETPDIFDKANILKFTGDSGPKGEVLNASEAVSIFEAIFTNDILQEIVLQTNNYGKELLESSEHEETRKHTAKWIETDENELRKFLALTLLMPHVEKEKIKDYWARDMTETPFFRYVMPRDRYLNILRCLHFSDNSKPPKRDDPNYDHLWKIRKIFDKLNSNFKEVYYPSEEIAVDEVIVVFKGKVIFRQFIPKKSKRSGIKIYKLADENGYTFHMASYENCCEEGQGEYTAAHATILELLKCVEGKGHKVFMDDFFSSPALFLQLLKEYKINSCGLIRYNCEGYPKNFRTKQMKKGDISVKFADGLTALCWRDKKEVFMLSSMHDPPCKFQAEEMPEIFISYNRNMACIDLSNKMANSFTFGRKTLKWTKKLFFHLLDLTVLNSFIIAKILDPKIDHLSFREKLIRQLLKKSECSSDGIVLKPIAKTSDKRYDGSDHWPLQQKVQRRCAVCSHKKIRKRTSVSCKKCDVGLCINCFEEYHTNEE